MAIRLDYVVKETGSNLVRNFTLTFAAILTVAVSLAMVAASYLIGQGISTSFMGLRSDVRLFVYMNPGATSDQIDSVRNDLEKSPQVKEVDFYDTQKTYDEFKKLFKDHPDLISSVKAADLPQSSRINPAST